LTIGIKNLTLCSLSILSNFTEVKALSGLKIIIKPILGTPAETIPGAREILLIYYTHTLADCFTAFFAFFLAAPFYVRYLIGIDILKRWNYYAWIIANITWRDIFCFRFICSADSSPGAFTIIVVYRTTIVSTAGPALDAVVARINTNSRSTSSFIAGYITSLASIATLAVAAVSINAVG